MKDLTGSNLKGYELQERLGAGGFGAVYRATQSTVGREVAIKIILPGHANKPEFIRRFESEAHLIARLEHHHIVPLYDYWRDPNGAYLVMRWLRGGSLLDQIRSNGALSIEETAMIINQLSQALQTAHRNKVIHRDIKPGNILMDEDGNAFLADFGIAKDHTVANDITNADNIVGSPDYLSPEQARSEPVTPQTDIYSLGVVLYEMLEGKHPFPNLSPVERLFKHLNEPLPDLETPDDDIRNELNQVVKKATAKDPMQRFKDVMELAQALQEAAQIGGSQAGVSLVELLTPREQEVLQLIIDGKSNREIAERLVLTLATVKSYVSRIYKKLNVRSRMQAIVKARDLDLVFANQTDGGESQDISWSALPEPDNPYKGLQAFQAGDAHDFYGRDKLIEKLISRLQEDVQYRRFLSIVGPSGSGKSSVTRAGLVPALWRGDLPGSDNWYIVDFLPGDRPLDELEVALLKVAGNANLNLREQLTRDTHGLIRAANLILPDDSSELLIVIDQFEEVFTLVENEDDRKHFLGLLKNAITDERSRVRIITTLRADYYDRPLQYPEFGELMRNRVETVLPLSADELEQAIRLPAENVGIRFEDGLVSKIVSDVHYQPGALPLLQYALTELFERRDGRNLTLAAYTDIGGTGGALAKRADEIYLEGNDEGQELVRQLFLRLVTLGEGAEDTRRRVERAELLEIAGGQSDAKNRIPTTSVGTAFLLSDNSHLMDEIIDIYAQSRLLSLDHDPSTRKPTVEVAHEAILREWERLREWLNNSRDDIKQERQIAHEAEAWQVNNRDKSYLRTGSKLEQAEQWQKSTQLALTPLISDFIQTSTKEANAKELAEKERAEREKQQELEKQRLTERALKLTQRLVAVFIVATVIAGGLALFAFVQRNDAIQSQNAETVALKESQRSAAEFRSIALTFGAQDALTNGQPDMALALAHEAINMDNPPFASEQMFFNTSNSSWVQQRFLVSNNRVWDVAYHPDGKRIITTSWDGRAAVWDIKTGEELQSIQREGRPLHIGIHPDANIVAISGTDNILQLWNLETNKVIEREGADGALAFTRDGTKLLSAIDGTTINIWDMDTLEIVNSWEAHDARFIFGINFNPDESLVITAANDGFAKIWDIETGEPVQILDHRNIETGDLFSVVDAQFLPDGVRVLVIGGGAIRLWNWRSGEIIWSVESPVSIWDMEFSPDGQTVVIGFDSSFVVADPPRPQARLYDVETGNLIRIYDAHSQRIQNVDFSSDGTTILTGSVDGTAAIWPVNWEGALAAHVVEGAADDLVVHPIRPLVAMVKITTLGEDFDPVIQLVNIETGEIVQELMATRPVLTLAFTPDGRYLLSGHVGSTDYPDAIMWDIETGEQVFEIDGIYDGIADASVSQDGQLAVLGEIVGNYIILWDITTGESHILEGHIDFVEAVVFSPDGQYVYSGGRDGALLQWDVQTGKIISQFAGHAVKIRDIDVNSDGTKLVSGSHDTTAIVWDTSTGEALFTLRGHTGFIKDVEFSPDDSIILTSSLDGTIILWDTETGGRIRTYVAGQDPLNLHAHFSPDGQTFISGANNLLTIWDVSQLETDLATWVTENRYIPDFTCEQRELYRIEPYCEDE